MKMLDEYGKLKARIFFISYEKEGNGSKETRPITFAFNGGPGSSSVWLHMGALGPRRVKMGDAGEALPAPYQLEDNPYTWLAFTDLVFIDPVMTGYSRPAKGEDKKQFHGVKEDVQSVGEFIRLYTTRYNRWLSPKFLAGESYGTTRAAGLSGYLLDRYGMYLSGICLVSSILQFETASFAAGHDLAFALYLPTYTATAWYHKKLPADLQKDLQETLNRARKWALGEYLLALAQGDQLSARQQEAIAEKLARFTGLSKKYVLESNLRIPIFRFVKELLRDERKTVGRLDSRFKGIDRDAAGERFEYDPSYAAIYGPFTAAINHYLRNELKYENDLVYEILTGRVQPWNWNTNGRQGYVNVAETLRKAMTQNPYLKVFIANGYYDLATPFFATEYTVSHMQLDPS
ncbi:MAG: peptidase S10, partial [Calditrichaeota bacterium]